MVDSSELFFRVWRNIVIKRNILKHLKLYNLYSNYYYYPESQGQFGYGNIYHPFKDYIRNVYQVIRVVNSQFVSILPYGDDFKSIRIVREHQELYSTISNHMCTDFKPIPLSYSNSITSLDFSGLEMFFGHDSLYFPPSLVKLKLDKFYNQVITKHSLPNLEYLCFGDFYDKQINQLPSSLRYLKLGSRFNQPIIPYSLPSRLETFIISSEEEDCKFNQPLSISSFPSSIKTIRLDNYNAIYHNDKFMVPNGVKSLVGLKLNIDSLKRLPSSITKLYISNGSSICFIPPNSLPTSITSIQLPNSIVLDEHSLPNSIIKVKHNNFKFIPPSVTKAKYINPISSHFDRDIFHSFGSSITSLSLPTFSSPLKIGFLSSLINLKRIKFPLIHSKIPAYSIPEGVEHIEFKSIVNPTILENQSLPESLTSLKLCIYEDIANALPQLPSSLRSLHIANPSFHGTIDNNWLHTTSLDTLILNGIPQLNLPLPNQIQSLYLYNNNPILNNKQSLCHLFKILKIYNK